MSARKEEFLRGLAAGLGEQHSSKPVSARARVHAMFTLDEAAEAELDARLDEHRAEVLAEVANPAAAATIYAVRKCVCDETPHPTWCPASIPTDDRITEIRQGIGEPLTPRELFWLKGAAGRHELHVIGARGLHWPLTDDLPGALLLVSQYLAAAVAVIERAGLAVEEATAAAATATPELTVYRASHDAIVMGHYTTRQAAYEHCEAYELRDDSVSPMAWNVDEDGVAELVRFRVPRSPGAESATGYVVTPLEVASEYDAEADE